MVVISTRGFEKSTKAKVRTGARVELAKTSAQGAARPRRAAWRCVRIAGPATARRASRRVPQLVPPVDGIAATTPRGPFERAAAAADACGAAAIP